MTVINGCIQGKRAYIITDTAWLAEDGSVVALGSKFIKGTAFPFLIALTGNANPFTLLQEIEEGRPRNGGELLEVLTGALRRRSAAEPGLDAGMMVATWNKREGRPMLHLLSNSESHWPGLNTAFNPFGIETIIGGPQETGELLGRPVDLRDPLSFDPHKDGAILVDEQRNRNRFEHLGKPAYRIGGSVEVGTLGRRGARIDRVHEWPEDRIGEFILPRTRYSSSSAGAVTRVG